MIIVILILVCFLFLLALLINSNHHKEKPKEAKEDTKRNAELEDIVAIKAGNSNGYFRNCAFCHRNFSYWYDGINSKVCPKCAYINWISGELIVATKTTNQPRYDVILQKLRKEKGVL